MSHAPFNIEAVEKRRKAILDQIAGLQDEAERLSAALDVYREFSKSEQPVASGTKLGPARPDGLPSLFVMTATVLREAGPQGLKGREIVDEIGKRYWPGVQPQQILPQVYQFRKKGRLRKVGDRFVPLENEAPAD